jgi:histidyl-tRNA synthetase
MDSFRSPRGTHDVLPEEAGRWQWIRETARDILRRHGYREIRTPLIEQTGLFLRGVGETTDIAVKEMYTFQDRRGRSLTLRPEGTAPVVRACIQHRLPVEQEVRKLYYFGEMFRYDRPQAGRNRQFYQLGCEAIGSASPYVDLEIILLWNEIFRTLGLSDITIALNSVGCRACRPGYQEAIREALSGDLEALCPDCRDRYRRNPLRILDCKVPGCRTIREKIPGMGDYLCAACGSHHDRVRGLLDSLGCDFHDDPFLVRGLDYYTRTAFEVVHGRLGGQSSIGGGGRYDDLVATLGGGDVPAVGFSAGLERILLAVEAERGEDGVPDSGEGRLDLFLVYTDEAAREAAFREMARLRKRFAADMDYTGRSLKAQLRRANRTGCRSVLIFGSDELERGCVRLRDMREGTEAEVRLAEIEEALRAHLSDDTVEGA